MAIALVPAPGVAVARQMLLAAVRARVDRLAVSPAPRLLEPPLVNVLELNLALRRLRPR